MSPWLHWLHNNQLPPTVYISLLIMLESKLVMDKHSVWPITAFAHKPSCYCCISFITQNSKVASLVSNWGDSYNLFPKALFEINIVYNNSIVCVSFHILWCDKVFFSPVRTTASFFKTIFEYINIYFSLLPAVSSHLCLLVW